MGDENINMVCYANDSPLVAENEDDLQRLLYKFSLSCDIFDLKVSPKRKQNSAPSLKNHFGPSYNPTTTS